MTNDRITPALISSLVVFGFYATLYVLLTGGVQLRADEPIALVLVGVAFGASLLAFGTVLAFWLGSSAGSRTKDDIIAKVVTPAPPVLAPSIAPPPVPVPQAAPIPAPMAVPKPAPLPSGRQMSGPMSTFGGPDDTGMAADEGLALVELSEATKFADVLLPYQPHGTTGLGRRLNPDALYIACRWDYGATPRAFLQATKVTVAANGKTIQARPVDWGPNAKTGRIADLSPGAAKALGLATDDTCTVVIPIPGAEAPVQPSATGPLAVMQSLDGTSWAAGDGPNAKILSWLQAIAAASSADVTTYCNAAAKEPYFSWCGLAVAYAVTQSGFKPVFGAQDVDRFLYATSWLAWGTAVADTPKPGDVVVFDFGGGDHHVSLFEADAGNGLWRCHGGNQSNQVKASNYPKAKALGIRRAP